MTSFFVNLKAKHREAMVKDNLTKELNAAVKDVQLNKQLQENDCYITSEDASKTLVTVLEAIFVHGIRETFADKISSAFGDPDRKPTPEFWSPMMIFTHGDTISQVSGLSQIANDVGRSRSWIRLSLNEGLLLGYLFTIVQEVKSLKSFYKKTAYLLDPDCLNMAISYFQGLSQFRFTFPINSSVLNYWSNEILLLAGLWTPPMKECPVASGMDIVKSLPDADPDTESVESWSSLSTNQKLLLDDDEALKIILNTPTEGSPIQSRLDAEKRAERNAARKEPARAQEVASTGQWTKKEDEEIGENSEIENVHEIPDIIVESELSPAESTSSDISGLPPSPKSPPPQCSTMLSYDRVLESYSPQSSPLLPESHLKDFIKNYEPSISVPNAEVPSPDELPDDQEGM